MSHFTVLVEVSEDTTLETLLEPFYEQGEATDYYMEFDDQTEDLQEEYKNKSTTQVRTPDGVLVSPYDDRFLVKEPGKLGSHRVIPEDHEKIEVPFKDLYSTFEEFVQEWHGMGEANKRNGRWGWYMNPNAKWDWWTIGGRWDGVLRLKEGWRDMLTPEELGLILDVTDPDEDTDEEMIGKKVSSHWGWAHEMERFLKEAKEKGFDQTQKTKFLIEKLGIEVGFPTANGALKKVVDVEAMKNTKYNARIMAWHDRKAFIEGNGYTLEEAVETLKQVDAYKGEIPRGEERENSELFSKFDAIFHENERGESPFGWAERELTLTLEEWMDGYEYPPSLTFAFLTADGEWCEAGEMGWWGFSSATDDSRKEYSQIYWEWLEQVPANHQLIVVDCHI